MMRQVDWIILVGSLMGIFSFCYILTRIILDAAMKKMNKKMMERFNKEIESCTDTDTDELKRIRSMTTYVQN